MSAAWRCCSPRAAHHPSPSEPHAQLFGEATAKRALTEASALVALYPQRYCGFAEHL